MSENVCKFNKNGYCKFKETCRKRHINDICRVTSCVKDLCVNRHPKECKYFITYNYCKFGEYCAFEHKKRMENNSIENALQEIEILKNEIVALKQSIIEINEKMQEQTKMKFKCNECDFFCDTNIKLKKHMKASHTHGNIPQIDGNDTIDEEEQESVEYSTEDSLEKEISYEIFYEQKKCKTEFKTEVENLWNDIKVNFGYDILQVSDKHSQYFTVNISPDIRHGTTNEDIKKVIVWPEDCSVSSISINLKKLVYHKYSGLDLPWT